MTVTSLASSPVIRVDHRHLESSVDSVFEPPVHSTKKVDAVSHKLPFFVGEVVIVVVVQLLALHE